MRKHSTIKKERNMSNTSHHHKENHSVYIKVGIIFVAVIAALFFLAMIN